MAERESDMSEEVQARYVKSFDDMTDLVKQQNETLKQYTIALNNIVIENTKTQIKMLLILIASFSVILISFFVLYFTCAYPVDGIEDICQCREENVKNKIDLAMSGR